MKAIWEKLLLEIGKKKYFVAYLVFIAMVLIGALIGLSRTECVWHKIAIIFTQILLEVTALVIYVTQINKG